MSSVEKETEKLLESYKNLKAKIEWLTRSIDRDKKRLAIINEKPSSLYQKFKELYQINIRDYHLDIQSTEQKLEMIENKLEQKGITKNTLKEYLPQFVPAQPTPSLKKSHILQNFNSTNQQPQKQSNVFKPKIESPTFNLTPPPSPPIKNVKESPKGPLPPIEKTEINTKSEKVDILLELAELLKNRLKPFQDTESVPDPEKERIINQIQTWHIVYTIVKKSSNIYRLTLNAMDLNEERIAYVSKLQGVEVIVKIDKRTDIHFLSGISNLYGLVFSRTLTPDDSLFLPDHIKSLEIVLEQGDLSVIDGRMIAIFEQLEYLKIQRGHLLNAQFLPKSLKELNLTTVQLHDQPKWLYLFERLEILKIEGMISLELTNLPNNLKEFEFAIHEGKKDEGKSVSSVITMIGLKHLPNLKTLKFHDYRANPFGEKLAKFIIESLSVWNGSDLDDQSLIFRGICDFIVTNIGLDKKDFVEGLTGFFKDQNIDLVITESNFDNVLMNFVKKPMNKITQ
jgi:hypothetical protein